MQQCPHTINHEHGLWFLENRIDWVSHARFVTNRVQRIKDSGDGSDDTVDITPRAALEHEVPGENREGA